MRRERIIPPEVLLEAYTRGLFPMADSATGRIGWYSADPRAILPLNPFHVPRRVKRSLKSAGFTYTRDQEFVSVIRQCADRDSTWISRVLRESYIRLHEFGFAHSVETWREGVLVGGLYGVALGGVFFGESMFHRVDDAAKGALVYLADHLNERGYQLLEIQMITSMTAQFGAQEVSAAEYGSMLRAALELDRSW
jgi:leucyl/phenylalanyl-tRNA--protein transferase